MDKYLHVQPLVHPRECQRLIVEAVSESQSELDMQCFQQSFARSFYIMLMASGSLQLMGRRLSLQVPCMLYHQIDSPAVPRVQTFFHAVSLLTIASAGSSNASISLDLPFALSICREDLFDCHLWWLQAEVFL